MSRKVLFLILGLTLVLTGCAATKKDWWKAVELNSKDAYAEFIAKHPESELVVAAEWRIQSLELGERLGQCKTASEMGKLLDEYPRHGDVIVPALESRIVAEIMSDGPGERLVIQGVPAARRTMWVPQRSQEAATWSFTSTREPLLVRPEPVSITLSSPDSFLTARDLENQALAEASGAYLRQGVILVREFFLDAIPVSSFPASSSPEPVNPVGSGSVHRFRGRVSIGDYTFVGTGRRHDRLTFSIIDDVGYVWVRGSGKVELPDGKEIVLGD